MVDSSSFFVPTNLISRPRYNRVYLVLNKLYHLTLINKHKQYQAMLEEIPTIRFYRQFPWSGKAKMLGSSRYNKNTLCGP